MGRFSIGGFEEHKVKQIVKVFSKFTEVVEDSERDGEIRLVFKSTKYGKVMLWLLPKKAEVGVMISHDIKNPNEEISHCVWFDKCVKTHIGRSDAVESRLFVTFENESGHILEIDEKGKIYMAKPLPGHWKALGDK
ncbi:MAG: hypothetical protein Q7K44_02785 [Candidatus Liptonbacteria bacterium]|nr:hypothetical protein [Candidatus Liptonbacteria bacterium]